MNANSKYFKGLSRKDYIQKAHEIIRAEGMDAVSIRRLAKDMQCSSASLYRYFSGRDELLYFSQLPTLRNYIKRVNQMEEEWGNIWEVYIGIWYSFSKEAFSNAEAFDLLFFSNINLNLDYAIKEYYSMFPEDLKDTSKIFQEMFQIPDFQSRDMLICKKSINEGAITEQNGEKLNRIVCMMFEGYLKSMLDHRAGSEEIESKVSTFIEDVDGIIHWLAGDLRGYEKYLPLI